MIRPEILQLGPGLAVRGGISSVERLIMEHFAQRHLQAHLQGDIELRHVATMEDGSLWHKLRVFLRAVGALHRATRRPQGARLVHIHFSKRGSTLRKLILAWMCLRAGRPLILHAHSGSFDQFHAALPASARRAIHRIFARADRMIVLSKHWRDFYVQQVGIDPRRVVILSNPVAVPPSVPQRRGRTRVQLLFLGRISGHKGAFDLLRAYESLPQTLRARSRVVFAGDGEVEQLRGQARAFGDAIEVHSWIATAQRDALLQGSDLFVLPSYYEGIPMAMLEAMAFGLPVVSTRVGGIPEVVEDQREGLLVAPGEPAQLRSALISLIEGEDRRLAMGRQARVRAMDFDVRGYVARLSEVYEDVLQQYDRIGAQVSQEAV